MANIVITGSSRGIGFQLAQLFANEGHKVLALSRNNAPIAALNHGNISSFSFDLAKESDYERLEEFMGNNWKRVDVLINNAGKLLNQPFLESELKKSFIESQLSFSLKELQAYDSSMLYS